MNRLQKANVYYKRIRTHRLFVIQAALLVAIAIVHASALAYNWYYLVWWLDIPMHFFGGVWVALVTCIALDVKLLPRTPHTLAVVLASVITVGLLWEFFEIGVAVLLSAPIGVNYWPDTQLDLLMDVIGALVVWGIMRKYPPPLEEPVV